MSALRPPDRFGPWADNLTEAERTARLRAMRAIVRLVCGPRGLALDACLERAEASAAALAASIDELDRLTPLDRRRVLASYAALHEASPNSGRSA